jgi:hypothetical protein
MLPDKFALPLKPPRLVETGHFDFILFMKLSLLEVLTAVGKSVGNRLSFQNGYMKTHPPVRAVILSGRIKKIQ